MFRKALLLLSLLSLLFGASETEELAALKGDAIVIGEGATDAYVFADPKCLYSQDFIDTIVHNAALRRRFRYHVFLFNMPQVDSTEVIDAIYAAPSPEAAMQTYMLRHEPLPHTVPTPAERAKIERIKEAAEWLAIEKTPFILLDKKPAGASRP